MSTKQLLVGLIFFGFLPLGQTAEISIGTASRAGVYYQVGRSICRLVNAGSIDHGVTCQSLPTAGSIANLEAIRSGELSLAVVQSDWQFHAYHGSGRFQQPGADPELRALFSVHSEPFTVVARADAEIGNFEALRGKRVNIGNPGSGQRATLEVVMAAWGWDLSVFSLANQLPASQQSLALCHNRVQAMVYTVGHPNPSVAQAAELCDAVIVEVAGPAIDQLVTENPYYAYTIVPGGIYPGNPESIKTFGVRATVVASSRVDSDTVFSVVQAVFDQLQVFKAMHPAFGALMPEEMVKDGLSAPVHEGARRYFLEKGLISE